SPARRCSKAKSPGIFLHLSPMPSAWQMMRNAPCNSFVLHRVSPPRSSVCPAPNTSAPTRISSPNRPPLSINSRSFSPAANPLSFSYFHPASTSTLRCLRNPFIRPIRNRQTHLHQHAHKKMIRARYFHQLLWFRHPRNHCSQFLHCAVLILSALHE